MSTEGSARFAAAHHADIAAGGGGVQQKIVDGRALLPQQGHGHLLAAALHGAAADGTGEPPVGTHQHLRAALPGGAARCVDQRHQTVNFMMLKMIVEFEEGADPKKVMKDVQKNCKVVEDDCEIFL